MRQRALQQRRRTGNDRRVPLLALSEADELCILDPRCSVPKGSLQIEEREPLGAYETEGESGQPLIRKFCPNCGSGIITDVTVTPDLEWIKAGTLDDTSWLQPQVHWWCDSAQPWVKIDEAVPAFAGNPPLG